jgi:hypothetical protein
MTHHVPQDHPPHDREELYRKNHRDSERLSLEKEAAEARVTLREALARQDTMDVRDLLLHQGVLELSLIRRHLDEIRALLAQGRTNAHP